jgi:hypothetical protein
VAVVVSEAGVVVEVTGASVVTVANVVGVATVAAIGAASLGLHAAAISPATKTMAQTRDMAESIRQTPGFLAPQRAMACPEGRQNWIS